MNTFAREILEIFVCDKLNRKAGNRSDSIESTRMRGKNHYVPQYTSRCDL